jgi:hypothetical protein
MDSPELAMKRMKERYRAQLDSPLTTLWEGWGIGKEGYGGGSYNHAWSGGPLTCLSQYAAGISPTAPGFKSFIILPQMGSLRQVTAKVDSPEGMIEVKLARTDNSFNLDVRAAGGQPGEVGIPKPASGTPRFSSGGKPIQPDREQDGYHMFAVPADGLSVEASW